MYGIKPNLIVGFHGCDAEVCQSLLNYPDKIKISGEPYDWLGHGMYFWENNHDRAFQWALDKQKLGIFKTPAVIGAALQLGYCYDFMDTRYIEFIRTAYQLMVEYYKVLGKELPKNKDTKKDPYKDKLLRELDCTAIEFMHAEILRQVQKDIAQKGYSHYKIFDSVRGVFTEGGPAFEGGRHI